MTDTALLREKIEAAKSSITKLAEALNLSREGFYKKLNNETEFKASEVQKLSQLLDISETERSAIFFKTV